MLANINCEVKATIDKASGRVTHISHIITSVLEATVNMFGTHNAAVGLTFEKRLFNYILNQLKTVPEK